MRCVVYKMADGSAKVGRICNEAGKLCAPSEEALLKHLDGIVARNGDILGYRFAEHTDLPGAEGNHGYDATFRNAFTDDKPGKQVDVDMPKAKDIAHTHRRRQRDELMAPLDTKSTIPSEAVAAEAARVVVRSTNSETQVSIDAAADPVALKQVMVDKGLV